MLVTPVTELPESHLVKVSVANIVCRDGSHKKMATQSVMWDLQSPLPCTQWLLDQK